MYSNRASVVRFWRRFLMPVLLVVAMLAGPTTGHSSPLAAKHLQPYTGTFAIHWTELDWNMLPQAALSYTTPHEAIVHWAVRDRRHWRVDIQITRPALESGTMTGTFRGWTFTEYDARSGFAVRYTLTRPIRQLLKALGSGSVASGETFFGTPGAAGDPANQPDPTRPFRVTAATRHNSAASVASVTLFGQKVPLTVHMRFIRRRTFLGRTVDVIGIHPGTFMTGSCKKNGKTATCTRGYGWLRLWFDQNHPFLLRRQLYGAHGVRSSVFDKGNVGWTATQVQYGVGPSNADLAYQPPVPIIRIPKGGELGSGSEQGMQQVPKPFLPAPAPKQFAPQLTVAEGTYGQGSAIYTAKRGWHATRYDSIQTLFSHGQYVTKRLENRFTVNAYVKGPFLLVQQELQAGGLPAALQTGTPQTAGACQGWSSTLPDGQHLYAFARGPVSVLLSSNVMSGASLVAYVGATMCR
jgi:hypothetical protein